MVQVERPTVHTCRTLLHIKLNGDDQRYCNYGGVNYNQCYLKTARIVQQPGNTVQISKYLEFAKQDFVRLRCISMGIQTY